jgi:DNA invertase Pin-like site-specific DNA recombinase/cytochrome c553
LAVAELFVNGSWPFSLHFAKLAGMAERKRVVSLIRVSREAQAKENRTGIPRQRRDVRFYAEKYGLEIVREFQLEGISGTNVQKTAEFREICEMLAQPSMAGLVIPSIDRLTRYEVISDLGKIIEPLDKLFGGKGTNKRLWCDAGCLDTHNREDQSKILHAAEYAAIEREKIKYRTSQAREMNREQPDKSNDKLPRAIRFVVDNKEEKSGHFEYTDVDEKGKRLACGATEVRNAMRRLLAGDTLRQISEECGYASPTALRRCLESQWWLGVKTRLKMHINREWKDGRYTTGKRVAHTRPLEIKTNLYHENPTEFWPKPNSPLVSREMFDAVQNVLRQHHTEFMQKKSIANDYLGTGLLHCACGLKMYHQCGSASKPYEYYRCARTYQRQYKGNCTQANIATPLIDERIVRDAMEFFKNKKFIAAKIRESTNVAKREENERSAERERATIAQLEVQHKRQAKRFDMGDDSAGQDIKETLSAIAAAKDRLRKSETRLAETLSESDIDKMSANISREFARFNKLTRTEQKEILLRHVERINLAYAMPASLGAAVFASGPSDSLPGATEMGRATADEWARNVMGFALGDKPAWQLEVLMKVGLPDPYFTGIVGVGKSARGSSSSSSPTPRPLRKRCGAA